MEEGEKQRRSTNLMTKPCIEVRLESKRAFALGGLPWLERWRRRNPFRLGDDRTRPADGTLASTKDRKVGPTCAPTRSNKGAAAEGSARVGDVLEIEGPPRLLTEVGALELPEGYVFQTASAVRTVPRIDWTELLEVSCNAL